MFADITLSASGGQSCATCHVPSWASSLAMQAQQPFIMPFEMANHDAAEVVGRLQQSAASLAKFVEAYGKGVLADADTALQDMGLAIATYEYRRGALHAAGLRRGTGADSDVG